MSVKLYLESIGLSDLDFMDSGMLDYLSELLEGYHEYMMKQQLQQQQDMQKKKKILIVAPPDCAPPELMLMDLKEKVRVDVVVCTPQQAKEQGLTMSDFVEQSRSTPYFPPAIIDMPMGKYKSGQEKRRDRRKNRKK